MPAHSALLISTGGRPTWCSSGWKLNAADVDLSPSHTCTCALRHRRILEAQFASSSVEETLFLAIRTSMLDFVSSLRSCSDLLPFSQKVEHARSEHELDACFNTTRERHACEGSAGEGLPPFWRVNPRAGYVLPWTRIELVTQFVQWEINLFQDGA